MVVTDMTDDGDCFLAAEHIVSVKRTFDEHDRDILLFGMVDGRLVTVNNSDGISIEEVVKRICAEKLTPQYGQLL